MQVCSSNTMLNIRFRFKKMVTETWVEIVNQLKLSLYKNNKQDVCSITHNHIQLHIDDKNFTFGHYNWRSNWEKDYQQLILDDCRDQRYTFASATCFSNF